MRYFLCLFLVSLASAQTAAGGKWLVTVVTDKMTDAKTEQFTLSADSEITDSAVNSLPVLSISCSGSGHFNAAQLQTGVVLSTDADRFYKVRVRLDDKFSDQLWERYEDSKTLGLPGSGIMGKHWLKAILKASDVRFQLTTFSGYQVVARFTVAGLNRDRLAHSCGLK